MMYVYMYMESFLEQSNLFKLLVVFSLTQAGFAFIANVCNGISNALPFASAKPCATDVPGLYLP